MGFYNGLAAAPKICPQCSAVNTPDQKVCKKCGAELPEPDTSNRVGF